MGQGATEMTKTELKQEFRSYWLDIKDSAKREGFTVNRAYEAEQFIENKIANGDLPATAAAWKI
jgi:hypothetical protein